ncbi:uncharacterized protein PRCAT00000114001 [Priceomyces carsonii]|uniref:uncharacterized protein n=1 Tax=Priceomyces carsonii TaxID=28549 RepID=UPI002EDABECA|nr:unnamed protein product [Priceomyces carsonii]
MLDNIRSRHINPGKLESYTSRLDEDLLPGTIRSYASHGGAELELELLKKKDSKILVPQPDDLPKDPLNWSKKRKYWNTLIVLMYTGFTAGITNLSGLSDYTTDASDGILFIGIAFGTYLLAPSVNLYGRRISYLICLFWAILGMVWVANAHNTGLANWAQLLVGASESCGEAQVQLSLTDLFFEYQLGSALNYYVLATGVGTFIGPLISGFIDELQGFKVATYTAVGFAGANLLLMVFFMDETVYFRKNTRKVKEESEFTNEFLKQEKSKVLISEVVHDSSSEDDQNGGIGSWFRRQMKVIAPSPMLDGTGFIQYMKQLFLLPRVLIFPPVIFSGFVWGIQNILMEFYMTIQEDNYYDPPYNYSDNAVAIMNVPTLIGVVIGCFYGGTLNDWFSNWIAKRNDGVVDAEVRLWFLYIPCILSSIGLLLFGIGTDQQWSWVPTYIGLGFIGVGYGSSGDLSMTYVMLIYPDLVIEMMCGISFINNMLGCIFSFACDAWLENVSITNTFIILAVMQFMVVVFTIPMMVYGKKCRQWTLPSYIKYCELRDSLR